MTTAME